MRTQDYVLASFFAAVGVVPSLLKTKYGSIPQWVVKIGGCVTILALTAGLFEPLSGLLKMTVGGQIARSDAIALGVLAFVASAAIVWWSMPRGVVYNNDTKLKRVAHRVFKNEVVPLDGMEYIDCTFENITFYYNGTTRISLVSPNITSGPRFRTDNKSIVATLALIFHGLGAYKLNEIVDTETGHNILKELGRVYQPAPETTRPSPPAT
jgi:hypothetical protein